MVKRLLLIVLLLFVGCSTVPQTADLLVRYPVKGEIVWMNQSGKIVREPYFIIEHEDLVKFLNDALSEKNENNNISK